MSRWVFAPVALCVALAPVRAADPKPLWETKAEADAKQFYYVRWVGFSSDGKLLAAQVTDERDVISTSPSRVLVWDTATQKETQNVKSTTQIAFNGAMLANATTRTGSVLVAGNPPSEVRLSDGARAEVKDVGWTVGVWTKPQGAESLWLKGDGFDDYRFAYGKMPPFAPNPKKEEARERWMEAKFEKSLRDSGPPVVTVSADLTRVAAESNDGKLTLHTIAIADNITLTRVASVPIAHQAPISVLRFSPDGKTLATGSRDTAVCLWDIEKAGKDWKPRATIATGNFTVAALAFSPDGKTLAAGTLDGRGRAALYVIEVTGGKMIASYRIGDAVLALAYSPDGKTLVTGHSDGRVKVWDAAALRNP
jgi:WD40 repeat protein